MKILLVEANSIDPGDMSVSFHSDFVGTPNQIGMVLGSIATVILSKAKLSATTREQAAAAVRDSFNVALADPTAVTVQEDEPAP